MGGSEMVKMTQKHSILPYLLVILTIANHFDWKYFGLVRKRSGSRPQASGSGPKYLGRRPKNFGRKTPFSVV